MSVNAAAATPIRGWKPWNSPESASRQYIDTDSQEQIDICLERCPYRECVNCVDGGTHARLGRPANVEPEMLAYLMELKDSDPALCGEVCAKLGYNMRTVCYYANKRGKEGKKKA